MEHKVIVIGGANADIAGTPSSPILLRDSNIGSISVHAGGVGRNIAEALSKLGAQVSLITAFGDDCFADYIIDSCEYSSIDISMSRRCTGYCSSMYLYINDGYGDMLAAVNDMSVIELITPDYLSSFLNNINSYDACVIDANLSIETLTYISENVSIPIYADPVSSAKLHKLVPIIPRLTAIKPNRMEYEHLRDIPCRAYVSCGKDGITLIDGTTVYTSSAPSAYTEDTTGCGDYALAAIVLGELSGMTAVETADFAVKISSEKAAHIL